MQERRRPRRDGSRSERRPSSQRSRTRPPTLLANAKVAD